MNIVGNIESQLKKFFGFGSFKGNQEAIIENVLAGNDTFVIMPTGGGKSLCYQLPALMSEGTAIIVSPLIALMKNQVDAIRGHSTYNGVAHVLNSSLSKRDIALVKSDIEEGHTKLLYVAPESLTKDEHIEFLAAQNISFYAIDEAHCISEWGHDFRPEYRNLRSIIQRISKKPVIALTATATPKVQSDILKNLGMEEAHVYKSSFNRGNLYYEVRPKVNVEKEIIKFIRKNSGKCGIIYCLSRKKVEEIAQTLQVNGVKALPYHAGLDAASRVRHQDQFLMEDVDVIVATIAFGMGIDKPDVRFVIHHDIPKSLESYYQETGRAGRDGGEGICLAFYDYKDIEKLEKFMNNKPVSEQEIGRQLLAETVGFAENGGCRRKYILHYFGEIYDDSDCNSMCDNCRYPREKFEAKDDALLVLKAIKATNSQFKSAQIAQILIGKLTARLKAYKINESPVFSEGADKSEKHWMAVIRQLVVRQYLDKDIESYGVLKLNKSAEDYMKNPQSFMMSKDHDYDSDDDEGGIELAKSVNALDQQLYNLLKDLTRKEAKKKGVPPYAVFSENSLNEMSMHYPTSLDELKNLPGIGEGKAQKFGKPFIELIARYVEENNIEKAEDLVVKSVINKSGLKVYIIQSTDRKIPLDDLASAKNLSLEELLDEIDIIVNSGTKVNIDYYLSSVMDDDQIEEIYDYFMEAEDNTIEQAMDEFDGEFTEEELRMVRIKFMSEVAN